MEPRKMMGIIVPGDEKIPVAARDWSAMKLAAWRSKVGWEIASRAALELLDGCKHAEGCLGIEDESEPCISDVYNSDGVRTEEGCPDRELRMSLMVIVGAARGFSTVDARRPADGMYMAPSRERYSEVIAELGITQLENDRLREALLAAGVDLPVPPTNETRQLPKAAPVKFSLPEQSAEQSAEESP